MPGFCRPGHKIVVTCLVGDPLLFLILSIFDFMLIGKCNAKHVCIRMTCLNMMNLLLYCENS